VFIYIDCFSQKLKWAYPLFNNYKNIELYSQGVFIDNDNIYNNGIIENGFLDLGDFLNYKTKEYNFSNFPNQSIQYLCKKGETNKLKFFIAYSSNFESTRNIYKIDNEESVLFPITYNDTFYFFSDSLYKFFSDNYKSKLSIVKLDSLGNIKYKKLILENKNIENISNCIDNKNRFVLNFDFKDTINFDSLNFFYTRFQNSFGITKLSELDSINWFVSFNSNNTFPDNSDKIINDIEDNIVKVFNFRDTLMFNSNVLDSTLILGSRINQNLVLTKIDNRGNLMNFKKYEIFNTNQNGKFFIKDYVTDVLKNVYIIYSLDNSSIEFSNNINVFSKESNYFLIKFDENFNPVWNIKLPFQNYSDINSLIADSVIHIGINTFKNFSFLDFKYQVCDSCMRSIIFSYNQNGELNNYFSINQVNNRGYRIHGLFFKKSIKNELYLSSTYSGDIDFDPTINSKLLKHLSPRKNMVFVSKFDLNSIYPFDSMDFGQFDLPIIDLRNESKYITYPNPFTNELKLDLETFEKDIILELFDLQGRKVLSKSFQNKKSLTLKTYEVSKGSYILKLKTKAYEKDYKVQKE
jgi:hypothetical protein